MGTIVAVLVIAALFAIGPTRRAIHTGVSAIGTVINRSANTVGGWFGSLRTAIRSKQALEAENKDLAMQVGELQTRLADSDQLTRENADLRAAMGRSEAPHFTLAAVLAKPPHSLYDTLIIDGGGAAGFTVGQVVYASGTTPIGTIAEVRSGSAVVRLHSAPGEQTEARLSPSNIDVTLVGRGGGNFSVTVPHDAQISTDAAVVTKEINPSVIALFKKITSDARDPFQTLLLAAPVNINELAFVEVRE